MFRKVIHPGDVPQHQNGRKFPVFCKIEYTEDGRLSISGVIGPKSNGDAVGGCGQIDMEFAHRDLAKNDKRYSEPIKPEDFTFAVGWDADKWYDFLDIWGRWHLNDMSPMCEHQRALGWNSSKEVTLYYFRLTKGVAEARKVAEQRAIQTIREGGTFEPTEQETKLANLPREITWHESDLPNELSPYYEPNGPQYNGDHYNKPSEVKTAGWVKESEHPEGLLSKPCPECGYKYGNAWLKEEVPVKVIEFLRSLPGTDKIPAWV